MVQYGFFDIDKKKQHQEVIIVFYEDLSNFVILIPVPIIFVNLTKCNKTKSTKSLRDSPG